MPSITYLKELQKRLGKKLDKYLEEIDLTTITVDDPEAVLSKFKRDTTAFEKVIEDLSEAIDNIRNKSKREHEEEEFKELFDESSKKIFDCSDRILEIEHFIKKEQATRFGDDVTRQLGATVSTAVEPRHTQRQDTSPAVMRLPKLEMTKFDGDIMKWTEFWELFEISVHNNINISTTQKFGYLKSLLQGKAYKVIEGLELSSRNYETAVEVLKHRFGNQQRITNTHMTKIMQLPVSTNQTYKLRQFYESMEIHLRGLETLDQDTNQLPFITIIMSKLPLEVKLELERWKDSTEAWNINELRETLNRIIAARESAESWDVSSTWKSQAREYHKQYHTTSQSLFSNERKQTNEFKAMCIYCKGVHYSDECPTYITVAQRKERIKGRCFICLGNHLIKKCNKPLKICVHCGQRGNHHRSLCTTRFQRNIDPHTTQIVSDENQPTTSKTESTLLSAEREKVIMQTATTLAANPNQPKKTKIRLLFDTGSNRRYITESCARKLKLKTEKVEQISVMTFGEEQPKTIRTPATSINLLLKDNSWINLVVNVRPTITGTIQRVPVSSKIINILDDFDLADNPPNQCENCIIDILIGNDYYLEFMSVMKTDLGNGLYLLKSSLGWILTGRTPVTENSAEIGLLISSSELPVSSTLENLWNLESIGIKDRIDLSGDDEAMRGFQESVFVKNQRYQVALPWKGNTENLPSNYNLAFGRTTATINKLKKNETLLKKYDEMIQDQLSKGVIEKVTQNVPQGKLVHYIPHQAVVTPQRNTTKVRIVYDASAKKDPETKSLNDCLYRGPVLLEDLCGLLLRFRKQRIGLVADIEKAFLQVGLTWNRDDDNLYVKNPQKKEVHTKRGVLQIIASIFDPCGYVSPVILQAKVFLQNLWQKDLDWDDPLPEAKLYEWRKIAEDLYNISEIAIPRHITSDSKNEYELLCFCDASALAYTAVIYLRQPGTGKTTLIFSKTRLAPKNKLTIPRLELMAVLIGVKALQYLEKELDFPHVRRILWTDSQCVMKWLITKKSLSKFVENRIETIKEVGNINYRYVSTKDNPADLPSRGCKVATLQQSQLWWNGPEWLTTQEREWPTWNVPEIKNENLEAFNKEVRKPKPKSHCETLITHDSVGQRSEMLINVSKYSSLTKLLRITALMFKYIKKCRREDVNTEITVEDLKQAQLWWDLRTQQQKFEDILGAIKNNKSNSLKDQLLLFTDENGLIRCRGRLQNSELDYDAKYPILLPRQDHYTTLIIKKSHENVLHSGTSQTLAEVRQRYWIPKGRSEVKRTLSECRICRKSEGGPYRVPPMPPLPEERVNRRTPFDETGLDYLGPLYVKYDNKKKKVWICLLTCLVTRAITLEIVNDLTAFEFILCLRRFIASRGKCSRITCDNAPQFKLTKTVTDKIWRTVVTDPEVKTYLANQRIEWRFIVELAPWMGGFYERLVGVVKRSLRKVIGPTLLDIQQLQTVVKEVEAIVNSRPLTYVGEDIDGKILTPADFLTSNLKVGTPVLNTEDDADPEYIPPGISSADKLINLWKRSQNILENFWAVWKNQYLTSLRESYKTDIKQSRNTSKFNPNIGDIVLIKGNQSRGSWKLGKICELIKSKDQKVRSTRVLLPNKKVINRPVKLLFPLELWSGECR
ncbi:Uncharacterised protein r2_g406 [Pycnogonum litorale]